MVLLESHSYTDNVDQQYRLWVFSRDCAIGANALPCEQIPSHVDWTVRHWLVLQVSAGLVLTRLDEQACPVVLGFVTVAGHVRAHACFQYGRHSVVGPVWARPRGAGFALERQLARSWRMSGNSAGVKQQAEYVEVWCVVVASPAHLNLADDSRVAVPTSHMIQVEVTARPELQNCAPRDPSGSLVLAPVVTDYWPQADVPCVEGFADGGTAPAW